MSGVILPYLRDTGFGDDAYPSYLHDYGINIRRWQGRIDGLFTDWFYFRSFDLIFFGIARDSQE